MNANMGRIKRRKKSLACILISIFAIVAAFLVTFFCLTEKNSLKKESADALNTGSKGAQPYYLNSSSTQLFNSSGSFNTDIVQKLFNVLVYGANNINGRKATINDVSNQGTMGGSTLRSRAGMDGGIVAYFAGSPYSGEKWQLTYVSKATNGATIATFWYADNWGSCTALKGNYKYACYGASNLRDKCITEANKIVSASFRSTYFVTPRYVSWQKSQSNCYASSSTSWTTYWPGNNSWGSTSTGVYDSSTSKKTVPNSTQMCAWADDYYWIPSAGEVLYTGGPCNASEANGAGIWGLLSAQKGVGTRTSDGSSYYTWTRSAYENSKVNYFCVTDKSGGRNSTSHSNSSRVFRPAVHLNLTAMSKLLKTPVNAPKNVSRVYTGKAINIAGESWYSGSSTYYNSSSMSVSPALSNIKAVGSYTVRFTLAANNAANCVWADTNATGTKTVTFTITKANLTVTGFSYNENTGKVTGISTSGAVNGESPPFSAFRIRYTNNSGGAISNPYTKPTAAGTYRVYPELYNPPAFYNNYNVIIGPTSFQTITVTNVQVPQALSRTYTGTGIVISDANWYNTSKTYYQNSSLITVSPSLDSIINVGTYDVTFTLAANGSNIYWSDTKNFGSKKVKFTVTPKDLTVTSFTYDEERGHVTGVTTEGQPSGQIAPYSVFRYKYTRNDGSALDDPYTKPVVAGKYRVYPEFAIETTSDSSIKAFYANYNVVIGPNSYQELTVEGIPIPRDFSRVYTGLVVDITKESWYSNTYFGSGGFVAYRLTCRNAGEYYVSFALKNSDLRRWVDGTVDDITIKVTITERPVYATVSYGDDDMPHTVLTTVIGNPESGVISGETVHIKYRYTDSRGNPLVGVEDEYVRPPVKGDYRAYAMVDPDYPPVNYKISNTAFVDFHLDGISCPEDIRVTYSGKPVDITAQPWYVEKYYGEGGLLDYTDISQYIDCHLSQGLPFYSVDFRMKPESTLYWSDGSSANRRTIHIYIDPKPIDVYFIQNIETYALTVVPYDGEIEERDQLTPPVFLKEYKKVNEETMEEEKLGIYTEPTKIGLYHVYPIIRRNGGGISNYNYIIKQPDYYYVYTVQTAVVNTPTVNNENNTAVYTGEPINFILDAGTLDCMNGSSPSIREFVMTEELKEQGVEYDSENYAFVVKNAGTYVIQFFLVSDDYVWDMRGGYMTITVEKRGLAVTELDGLSDDQPANTYFDVVATHNAAEGDYKNIKFVLTYQWEGEAPVTVEMSSVETDVKDVYTNKAKAILNFNKTGVVSVNIGLAPAIGNEAKVNNNYVLTDTMFGTITLKGRTAEILTSQLVWKYKNALTGTQEFAEGENSVEYNTREYTVFLDQTALRQYGLKVLSYTNPTCTKACVNGLPNITKATLVAYDDSWEYIETDFEFKWFVNKGLYDLTDVKWDYTTPFSYTGRSCQLYLQNLYGGLKATLIRANAKEVGDYTATVVFSSGDSNYEPPVKGMPSTYRFKATEEKKDFQWSIDWSIKKAVITPQWDSYGGTACNSDKVDICYPTLHLLPADAVKYTFYTALPGGGVGSPLANGTDDLRILNERETGYYVKAEIVDTATVKYTENYELTESINNPCYFTIGANKIPIKIGYTDPLLYYTGKAVPVKFDVLPVNGYDSARLPLKGSFNITFYQNNEPCGSEDSEEESTPVKIGVYEVRIELKSDPARTYYVQGKTAFTYTIMRAKADLPNAGWNYDPDKPFVFELDEEGNPVTHSVEFKGLNEKAYSLVYHFVEEENVRNESSEIGVYTASFDIVNLDEENYEPISLSDIDPDKRVCRWEIVPLTLEIPEVGATITFDGGVHNLTGLIGLPATYDRYLTTVMKYNGQIIHDPSVMDVGDYKVECSINPALAESGKVRWAMGEPTAMHTGKLYITPCLIMVKSWTLRTGQTPLPSFVTEPNASFYKMVYYYGDTQISQNEIRTLLGEKLTAEVVASTDYKEGDIIISSTMDSSVSFDFYVFSREAKPITKPTLANATLYYNGKIQQFKVNGFDADYMEYVGNSTLQRKDLGEDTVTIRLKSYQNVKWQDNTTADLVLTYAVIRGTIPPVWNMVGAPTLSVSDEYIDAIEHIYYDVDGRMLSSESLIHGKQYVAVAKVKPEFMNFFTIGESPEARIDFTYKQPGLVIEDPNYREVFEFPVWQVAASGVSIVLIIFFTLMTLSYAASANRSVQKTRKLAEITYSAAPVLPLMAIGWLGMRETGWTVVASALMGIAFMMLVIMLLYRRRSIRALQKLNNEQLRVNAERAAVEAERRREEARRREEELKTMLAGLQSNYNSMAMDAQNALAGNVQQMIAGTVNAMLPAVQQRLQELPPAPSDNSDLYEIIERHEETLKSLISRRKEQGITARTEEYAALGKTVAKLSDARKKGKEAADEREQLKKIIASQESLIEAFIDERKMYEVAAAADVKGAKGANVSLLEAFKQCDENVKALYFELGGYITSMPNIEQIDGKYAVLFKYRGKSLFKLRIIDGVPYFSYMMDNGMQTEIVVKDEISLEEAKQTVTMRMKRVDRNIAKGTN